MGNDITTNPWILDTAAVIRDDFLEIERMEYHPDSTGNIIQLEDKNGRIIWYRRAVYDASSDGVQVWDQPYTFNGFEVATITAGELYVWLKQPK
jgi:hypothetical protein